VIQQRISLLLVTGPVRLGDMWVAVMLVCLDPSALSCQVMAKPEAFYSEKSCLEESEAIATGMLQKGIYAVPACFEVGTSS
jgi:hypothetical protein